MEEFADAAPLERAARAVLTGSAAGGPVDRRHHGAQRRGGDRRRDPDAPHRAPGNRRLHVGRGLRVVAGTHRVLGVVEDRDVEPDVPQRVDERGQRTVAGAADLGLRPRRSSRSRRCWWWPPSSSSEASTRCLIRSSGSTGARYSSENASHISLGETSPPSPSVIFWIAWENSICSRRGSARPWSAFMM